MLLSDRNMPNMDGISLVRMIRGDPELKEMIVLLIAAETDKEHVMEAIKVGISDYIVKPFTADILQKKIEHIMEKRHQADKTPEQSFSNEKLCSNFRDFILKKSPGY